MLQVMREDSHKLATITSTQPTGVLGVSECSTLDYEPTKPLALEVVGWPAHYLQSPHEMRDVLMPTGIIRGSGYGITIFECSFIFSTSNPQGYCPARESWT